MRRKRLHLRGLLSESLQVDLLGHPAFPPRALDDGGRRGRSVPGPVLGALRRRRGTPLRGDGEKGVVRRRAAFPREPARPATLRLGLGSGVGRDLGLEDGRRQVRRLPGVRGQLEGLQHRASSRVGGAVLLGVQGPGLQGLLEGLRLLLLLLLLLLLPLQPPRLRRIRVRRGVRPQRLLVRRPDRRLLVRLQAGRLVHRLGVRALGPRVRHVDPPDVIGKVLPPARRGIPVGGSLLLGQR
ncbi:hypothetical protein EYF80_033263 [Liparis tanakae]|uniref:Uncharacterized protein n=1 Tax=Liparis tanakae TaxID=230148 RepID=A0A4Z2GSH1_9TELE|nr:hypothetical protein EYF80_033263 [Liparis tanakae]